MDGKKFHSTQRKRIMNKNEALKMAIEFMGTLTIDVGIKTWNEKRRKEAIQACKEALEHQEVGDAEIKQMLDDIEYYQKRVEALEQSAQEPVPMIRHKNGNFSPAPSWQGLSDEEIEEIVDCPVDVLYSGDYEIYRAIEAKLKEKNT